MPLPTAVDIREVGPRDGFQNEPETIATADKVALVDRLARTGLRRIEITSFVRPDVIPQLSDAREVLAAIEKDLGRNFTLTAAQAKLKTGRLAVRCAEEAVQIHGGYGYIEEYPVCRMYRDAKILTIGEGTDEIQRMVIARGLGA